MGQRRGTAHERGYGHKWRVARAVFLVEHPTCAYCQRIGRISVATVVDHITPHKGDMQLFWDQDNWQPLCAEHHSATKQREDRLGRTIGCDTDGVPLDPAHHWR